MGKYVLSMLMVAAATNILVASPEEQPFVIGRPFALIHGLPLHNGDAMGVISISLPNRKVQVQSVQLETLEDGAKDWRVIADMNDAGNDGDVEANDGIYTGRVRSGTWDTSRMTLRVGVTLSDFRVIWRGPSRPARVVYSERFLLVKSSDGRALSPEAGDATGIGRTLNDDLAEVERVVSEITHGENGIDKHVQYAMEQVGLAQKEMINYSTNPPLAKGYALQEVYASECLSSVAGSEANGLFQEVRSRIANSPGKINAYFDATSQLSSAFVVLTKAQNDRCMQPVEQAIQ